jgi:hypothetical protein
MTSTKFTLFDTKTGFSVLRDLVLVHGSCLHQHHFNSCVCRIYGAREFQLYVYKSSPLTATVPPVHIFIQQFCNVLLLTLCMLLQSLYHPTNVLCDTAFMTYINTLLSALEHTLLCWLLHRACCYDYYFYSNWFILFTHSKNTNSHQ